MSKIRILVVDDSVVVRRLLTRVLSSDPEIEVVGSAPTGSIALAKVPQLNPDLITLDLDMPDRDGPNTLAELRKTYPRLPVIAFTLVNHQSPAEAVEMMTLGACDYLTRAVNIHDADVATSIIRDELIPKIKMYGPSQPGERSRQGDHSQTFLKTIRPPVKSKNVIAKQRLDVLAIGVSTGGPNALVHLLSGFGSDFPVPILIVQHMPPAFTSLLAERLDKSCRIPVSLAASNQVLEPGRVWIAPGDFHMLVRRQQDQVCIQINQDAPENSCRPSVDVLFRSVAEVYGARALAVVLTGMGQDGLRGCEQIHDAGGQIFVQDEASSVVWGMPGFVANAGLADKILPLQQLGSEIEQSVWGFRSAWPGPFSVKSNV